MVAILSFGTVSFAPNKITFTNPDEQLLKDYAGYKDYVEEEKPEYDAETQKLVAQYTETDTEITCSWTVEYLQQDNG